MTRLALTPAVFAPLFSAAAPGSQSVRVQVLGRGEADGIGAGRQRHQEERTAHRATQHELALVPSSAAAARDA